MNLAHCVLQAVPLYLSEMAPPRHRGAINNGFRFSIGVGALSANLINFGTEKIKDGWGWRISLALAAVPASILTLGALFLPETPNSLIQRSKDYGEAELGDHGGVSKGYAFLVLILICVYVAGFGWSWGPLGWLVPSEIFPLEIRSAAQSITVAVSFLFTFIVAQTFLAMLCHLKSGIFFFFGGWVVLMTAFVYYLLPETKNLPIEQMDRVWKEHWFWKRIVVEDRSTHKMETA